MIQFSRLFSREIQETADWLEAKFIAMAEAQGLKDTGALRDSHRTEMVEAAQSLAVYFYMEHYGMALSEGVKPANIPFTLGSGRNESKFISELEDWLERKGDPTPLQGAFRIARAAKARNGLPSLTPRALGFSSTGKRRDFVGETINANTGELTDRIQRSFDTAMTDTLEVIWGEFGKTIR